MSNHLIDLQLDRCEQQFNALSVALIEGDSSALALAGAALQRLAVDLVQLVDAAGHQSLGVAQRGLRVKALATGLPVLRANLLRRSAYVEQALQVVAPAAPASTYATRGRYGNSLRQSGAFNVLSA